MNVLFVVVPVALVLVGAAIAAYVWSARRGQFDDLVTPALRALHDDPPARGSSSEPAHPDARPEELPSGSGEDLSSPPPAIV